MIFPSDFKFAQQICFKITRIFINTSVLRKTNRSNFEAKLFPSVPDIVNGHVVYWKAMRLGSVHFYDCFSPSTVFDLKKSKSQNLKLVKTHQKGEKKSYTHLPQENFIWHFLLLCSDQSRLSLVATSLGN